MSEPKFPERIAIFGDKAMFDAAIRAMDAKKIQEWQGRFPLFQARGGFGISHYYYGASAAAAAVDELAKSGASKLIFATTALPLEGAIPGQVILPTRAVRDEGASFHFLKPADQVFGNIKIQKRLKEELKALKMRPHLGMTWTTDAPFGKVRKTDEVRKSGAQIADNETAALFAAARYYGISLGGILLVNDPSLRKRIFGQAPMEKQQRAIISAAFSVLGDTKFWGSLKSAPKEKKAPKRKSPTAAWDRKISALGSKIDMLAESMKKSNVPEKIDAAGLALMQKDIFTGEYGTIKFSLSQKKATVEEYNRIALGCADSLEKIIFRLEDYSESKAEEKPDDGSVEEIYMQAAKEQAPAYSPNEPRQPLPPVRSNRLVYLVNLPRRFRYKPYYKQFFENPEAVGEIEAKEFVEKTEEK